MKNPKSQKKHANYNNLTEVYSEIMTRSWDILSNKNKEYSIKENPYAEFDSSSRDLKLDVKLVWAVYFRKHIAAIFQYCNSSKIYSNETIEDRILDAINYLVMLYGLHLREKDRNSDG